MKPHKHAELIKAWADGAEIQQRHLINNIPTNWYEFADDWNCEISEFRIKPEPKEDIELFVYVSKFHGDLTELEIVDLDPNMKLFFDGETGELKSAEVLR